MGERPSLEPGGEPVPAPAPEPPPGAATQAGPTEHEPGGGSAAVGPDDRVEAGQGAAGAIHTGPADAEQTNAEQTNAEHADSDANAETDADADRAALAARLDECQARSLRTLADFDNYRRRTAREVERAREEERDRVVLEWLPVLDNLEHALTNADADPTTIVEGVRGVRELALSALRRFGVSRIDETSVPFDPARHEVAAVAGSGRARPGRVIGILRPGYLAQGRLLRPAAVAVSTEAPDGDNSR